MPDKKIGFGDLSFTMQAIITMCAIVCLFLLVFFFIGVIASVYEAKAAAAASLL